MQQLTQRHIINLIAWVDQPALGIEAVKNPVIYTLARTRMRTIQEFCVFCCHKCHTILYNQLCNKWLPIIFKYILTNRERQRMFSFFFRLKNQGKERTNEGKMNTQTDFVWHLWQQKYKLLLDARIRVHARDLRKRNRRWAKREEENQSSSKKRE